MNVTLNDFDGQLLDGLEFCAKTYSLFETLRSTPGGPERLRSRDGETEKRLLEELLPVSRYIQTYHRLGRYISVRWINGNQSYDAEIYQRGDYVELGYYAPLAYLEATCAMHENEHYIWQLLNENKIAYAPESIDKKRGEPIKTEPVVFSNSEHVLNFAPIITSSIHKKAKILYPKNTSLVVQCHLNSLYMLEEWRLLVSEVERELPSLPFKEVLLIDAITERVTPLAFHTT